MRKSVPFAALLLAVVVAAASWSQPETPPPAQTVRVRVFADHFEMDGKRFEGSLATQLDRYADSKGVVSIFIVGDAEVVEARMPELAHLSGKPNIRLQIGTVAMRIVQ